VDDCPPRPPAGPAGTTAVAAGVDVAAIQRRTLTVLVAAQVLGGVGVAVSVAVSALLAAELGGDALSGLAGSASLVGGAVFSVPVARAMQSRGRGPGLALGYLAGAVGAAVVVVSAAENWFTGVLAGMVLFGAASAANFQSRYAATDLAEPHRRGTALSVVVWAATVGSVAGPNLAEPVRVLATSLGLPPLTGPFVLASGVLVLAAAGTALLLRPDPLRLARVLREGPPAAGAVRPRRSVPAALRWMGSRPDARTGLTAITVGFAVMVAVMTMTPLHLHHGGASLTVIGVVVSVHLLGMYAASPVVGLAVDRVGGRPVVLTGAGLLLVALAVTGTAGPHDAGRLGAGMTVLGLGFSCTLIAGSTLLNDDTPLEMGPAVQGAADLVMGAVGAVAGALAGVVVGLGSFGLLSAVAALLLLPLGVAALRDARASLVV
jgi:MFS family permease